MPQNPSLVAVKTSGIEVHVFDCSKHPEQDDLSNPDFRLQGHENEGYGLSWNPFKQGLLVSGSYDKRICLWDVSASPENGVLQPMHVYEVLVDNRFFKQVVCFAFVCDQLCSFLTGS